MENIEVRFYRKHPLELYITASAYTEPNGKKSIYINEALKEAPTACLDAIKGHEKVHLKGKCFLFDDFESLESKRTVLLEYARKYRFKEQEEKLKDPKNRRPLKRFNTEMEVAREISHINHHTANLIAYHEATDEETKNWIMFFDYIKEDDGLRHDMFDFITKKLFGRSSSSNDYIENLFQPDCF